MKKDKKIPMRPEDLPPQGNDTGTVLPPCPENFPWICGMGEEYRRKRAPRNRTYLGSVEWAWSPSHSRVDYYYLSSRGNCWLLWINWPDEEMYDTWYWTLYYDSYKKKTDIRTAAIYMLKSAWKNDVNDPGHFHFVSDDGLLSSDEFYAIAKEIWPEQAEQSEQ